MGMCAIITCKNRSSQVTKATDGVSYHMFPSDCARKSVWVDRTGRPSSWIPTKHSFVCSKHFTPNCFYLTRKGLRRLLANAVPSVLLPYWVMVNLPEHKSEPSTSNNCVNIFPENDISKTDDDFDKIKDDDTPTERRLKLEIRRLKAINEKRERIIKRLQQNLRRCKTKIKKKNTALK